MTLDIIIGKLTYTPGDDELDVEKCPPESHDVCDRELTIYPRDSCRSGSAGLWDFFFDRVHDIYMEMRDYPDSNDPEAIAIKPFLERINALPDDCNDAINNDRMKWFKFWCNRAVELYGDEAGIEFC